MACLQILIFYSISTIVYMNEVTENMFAEMTDLQELCPYSSFCGLNASLEFKHSSVYFPCCQSCSCSSDCGLKDNCCYSKHGGDKKHIDDVICRHSFREQPFKYRIIAQNAIYYKMVDMCHCSNEIRAKSGVNCQQSFQNMIFNPVYSLSTGTIYSNVQYAECNRDLETIPWQKSIVCPPNVEPSMPGLMDLLEDKQNGSSSSGTYGCLFYYIPPKQLNLEEAICFPNVIRKCNTTRHMRKREPFWDLCEKFNATFTIQTFGILKAYANVYCFMCNTYASIDNIKKMQCTKQSSGNEKVFQYAALTIILDDAVIHKDQYSKRDHQKRQICSNDTVLISSYKTECRPLQCKKGQLLINNRCEYFSRQWIGGPFVVMLRLVPVYKEVFIRSSFFTEMPERKRNDRYARWIKRRNLTKWPFNVLYHLSRDQTSVEYIVVKATYPSAYVDPHVLNEYVQKAMGSVWFIEADNITFHFKVVLNKYTTYDLSFQEYMLYIGINTTNKFGYFPKLVRCKLGTYYRDALEEILFPLESQLDEGELNKGFFVTKLFFCEQVDLLPEEFDFLIGCLNMIFFKVKNTTLHNFSLVTTDVLRLVNIGEEIKSTKLDKQTVRICANEFKPNLSVATVNTVCSLRVLMTWLVAIYFAYIF